MSDNLFDQYTPASDAQKIATVTPPYKAFETGAGKTQQRMRVLFGDGSISLFNNNYLVRVESTDPHHIRLFYTDCYLDIQGNFLSELWDLLQEDKVKILRAYNAKNHIAPANGDMKIESITTNSYGAN